MKENAPIYNLKAVIQETGLTPATLRAWERRYGLLKPQRSPGGHRLYTEHDIELLKWLVARQSEGLSISHAIQMWRNQEEKLPDRFQTTPPIALSDAGAGEDILDQLRNSWCAACMEFNEPAAEVALAQALAIAAPEVVCTQLLQKGLAKLGEGWYSGTVSVQQEHFASALAARRLNAMLAAAPAPTRPGRLLAACPSGEAHDLALLMLAFILRWHGWEVTYLGANTPLARLDTTLRSIIPRMVLSVAQTLPGAAALYDLAGYVNAQSIPLAYGGGIFSRIPALIDRIPGYFLGDQIGAAPQMIADLLTHRPSLPVPQPVNPSYAAALAGFKAKETQMITSVNQALRTSGIPPRNVEEANLHFTMDIASALALGDIAFLDYSAGWLKGLLENYGASPALAIQYYQAYHVAVQQHLGSQAGPILAWFTKIETAA